MADTDEQGSDDAAIPERWQRLHRFDYDAIRLPGPMLTDSPDAQSFVEELSQSHRRRIKGA